MSPQDQGAAHSSLGSLPPICPHSARRRFSAHKYSFFPYKYSFFSGILGKRQKKLLNFLAMEFKIVRSGRGRYVQKLSDNSANCLNCSPNSPEKVTFPYFVTFLKSTHNSIQFSTRYCRVLTIRYSDIDIKVLIFCRLFNIPISIFHYQYPTIDNNISISKYRYHIIDTIRSTY